MKHLRVFIVLITLMMALSACAKKTVSTEQVNTLVDKSAYDSGRVAVEMPAVVAPQASTNEMGSAGVNASAPVAENQMVIMNANLTIAVVDPGKSMADIQQMAADLGGFTVNSNLYKSQTSAGVEVPEAYISIRIPADKLNSTIEKIKALTDDPKLYVLSENISGEDVTQTYTDLKSRLKNLEEADAQLTKFYESATKTEDVLAIYNQKMSVTEQIEVLKGQIQYYEQASAKSLITVQLKAKETVAPLTVAGWQPVGVARNAVQALINALRGIANVLIWFVLFLLPILLVIGVPLYFLIRWLVRKGRKSQVSKTIVPPTPPAE